MTVERAEEITPELFRSVLGHYPTGVVVVTAMSGEGKPLGMVIGSFTSVSLDPPMVAYLPTRTSKTYAQFADLESFCINVLASDQEDVCRQFAISGNDEKFDGVSWKGAPSGAPVLDGVVAWIDCQRVSVTEAGDHDIVVGRTTAMAVERPVLPLLFFQGGYGRFIPRTLTATTSRDFITSVRTAELARCTIDRLAQEMGVECSIAVLDGLESVFAASANYSKTQGRSRLGARVPVRAPIGTLFVGDHAGVTETEWTKLLRDDESRQLAQAQLDRVRERGWSVSLYGSMTQDELDVLVQRYASPHRTPADDRAFADLLQRMLSAHEPVIEEDESYDVLHVSVPVRLADGQVPMLMRLGELPRGMKGSEVKALAAKLQEEAAEVARMIDEEPIRH